MIKHALNSFTLASSLQSLKSSKISVARSKLDKVLSSHDRDFDFLVAYDALMMVFEDRPAEAIRRFKECRQGLSLQNDDENYIDLFCRVYLAAYSGGENIAKLVSEAAQLNPRTTLKRFLLFPAS